MKKKFLSILAAFAVLVSFSACQAGNTGQTPPLIDSVTTVVEESVEMKTIVPPEDGWTVEQLNEVMYLNGKPFKLPCTFRELGNDFSTCNPQEFNGYPFENRTYNDGKDFDYILSELLYEDFRVGYIISVNDDILSIIFNDFANDNNLSKLFCINGANVSFEKESIEKALGTSYTISEANGSYIYEIDGINSDSYLTIVFSTINDIDVFSISYSHY